MNKEKSPLDLKATLTMYGCDEAMEKVEKLLSLLKEAKSLHGEMASGEWEISFKLDF